jgi:hypothetical protein
MSDFTVEDAFDALLNRLDSAYNERVELRCSHDRMSREVYRLEGDLRRANVTIADLRAENDRLRRRPAEVPTTPPTTPSALDPPMDTAGVLTPRIRGRCAFRDRRSHKVPADLLHDQAAAQEYVDGWTEAKAEAEGAPATAPVADNIPF